MEAIATTKHGATLILQMTGELTLQSAPPVRKTMESILTDETVTYVVLDMEHLSFIDSSGIGMLVALKSRLADTNKYLYLLKPPK